MLFSNYSDKIFQILNKKDQTQKTKDTDVEYNDEVNLNQDGDFTLIISS